MANMTQEELTKASREVAAKEGITPAAAAVLIANTSETPTKETKDNEPNDLD